MSGVQPGWAQAGGFVSIGVDAHENLTNEAAAERAEALNVLGRYAWSYDERQLESLGDTFTEDAVWFGTVLGDIEIAPLNSRATIVEWLRGHMDVQTDQRRHNTTNRIVTEQSPGRVRVLSYLLLTSATEAGLRVVTTGVYDTEIVKQSDGAWRIIRFFAGFDAPF